MYHFLFLFTIGPFISFLFIILPGRRLHLKTLYNIMLLNICCKQFWIYTVWWILNILVIVGYHFDTFLGTELISYIVYTSLIINGMLRIVSISATYATLPSSVQDRMRYESLDAETLDREDMLEDWTRQDPQIVKDNIEIGRAHV